MYITGREGIAGSKRTIITLSEEDNMWLEGYIKAFNVSVAEIIRQGIESQEKPMDRRLTTGLLKIPGVSGKKVTD